MADRKAPAVYTSRGSVEGEDWAAVAAALNERMAERRVGQQELAQLSGVSVSTLRQLQHGAGRRVQNKTLTAISRALDWPDDYLTGVLVAQTRPKSSTPQPGDETLSALRRIEEHLQELADRLSHIEAVIRDPAAPSRPYEGRAGTSFSRRPRST